MYYTSKFSGKEMDDILTTALERLDSYAVVNHGTKDTTFVLTPNTFHVWGEVSSLEISLGKEVSGIINEFLFQFESGSVATTLILPDSIKWVNETPMVEANKTYQCSIINNIGVICGV